MENAIAWAKSHPKTLIVIAVGVLVLIFWPRASGTSDAGGTTTDAAVANAVANTQAANAALQLSHDQVQIAGLESAAAVAMAENNNSALVSIANIQAQSDSAAIAAGLSGLMSTNAAALQLGQTEAAAAALTSIADVIPTTQAQSLNAGKATDAAGFGLLEMFKNMLNSAKDIAATQTLITSKKDGSVATVYGDGGAVLGSSFQGYRDGGQVFSQQDAAGNISGFNTAWGKVKDATATTVEGRPSNLGSY